MSDFLGIEIGGTKLQLVLADADLRILRRFRFKIDQAAGARGIRECIEDTLKQLKDTPIETIGVGFGGPIDRATGKIFTSYHINGWSDFSLKDWLQQISGTNVVVDNDANVAALGEALYGAGKSFQNVFYVTIGSGVGSGLVLDGKIYHGAVPGETEFGHVRLDKQGNTVQSSCSGWAVDGKIRNAILEFPKSRLARLAKDLKQNEATILGEALAGKDPQAVKIFESTMEDFAFGLSHAIHLLHPHIVILGGGLSLLGEPLRKAVEGKVKDFLMDAFQPGPPIRLSALNEDAVTIGAIGLAIQNIKT
jgi:glucokinase